MPPFSKVAQLVHDYEYTLKAPPVSILRGYPLTVLNDTPAVQQFLEKELWPKDLELMAPRLWIMSTFSSSNVNPLHRQRVKGREIVVTEEPRLHLVWIHDRIFVKPLPQYLLSHEFWETYIENGPGQPDYLCKAATGFLRTYRYLIQHESDFHIAQQDHLRLVPKNFDWPSFCRFISELSHIKDSAVSNRYYYGELRLTRLNFYAPFLLGKFYLEQVHGKYKDFFGRLFRPILFVFAVVSTILNSMQIALTADQRQSFHWEAIWHVSRYFSIFSLVATTVISSCLILLWLWIFLDEWIYTLRQKQRKKREARNTSSC